MKNLLRKKRKTAVLAGLAGGVLLFSQCHKAADFADDQYDERLSGGAATVFDESSRAFTHAMPGLGSRDQFIHDLGDGAFEQTFVSSGPVNAGLGPIFNNVSCISCHHNDGKGTPTAGFATSSMLFRISVPGQDPSGGPMPVAGYGGQLQDQAIQGTTPEGRIDISYTGVPVTYDDGTTVTLRKPEYRLSSTYTAMPAGCAISPRLAPPVFGLGLLELIPEQTLLSIADVGDADGDGISGRPNYVYDAEHQTRAIGRFGLKAGMPTIMTQVAAAYNQDMGLTNRIFRQESCYGQPQAPALSDQQELYDTTLAAVAFYIKSLAVPARRNVADAAVVAGSKLFTRLQCARCHIPTLQTQPEVRWPSLSNQRIHPYTDLLLHDMGEGLADNRADFMASGTEWRTAPLWGIGLFEKTNGTAYYLHDGRARSIEEAILWHGGEGAKARDAFKALGRADREALLRFLKSL